MSSKDRLLAAISSVLLTSVCFPAMGNAQTITVDGVQSYFLGSVTVNGAGQPAVHVKNSGGLTAGNTTLKTTGSDAYGIVVDTSGQVKLTNTIVKTEGIGSHGLNIVGPGLIDLTGSTVNVSGANAWGAYLNGAGAKLILQDSHIISEHSGGISAINAANITMTGGSITTLGSPSHSSTAVELVNSNGYLGGVAIETTAGGVKASGTSVATLTNVTITSTGD